MPGEPAAASEQCVEVASWEGRVWGQWFAGTACQSLLRKRLEWLPADQGASVWPGKREEWSRPAPQEAFLMIWQWGFLMYLFVYS